MKMKVKSPESDRRVASKAVEETLGHAATTAILESGCKLAGKRKAGHIPAKWARHYERLLELRGRLEAERRNSILAASQPLETYSMDIADAATDEFDHDLAFCFASAEQDALYEVDEALKRIEDGTYGICEMAGKPIAEARLNVLPWTRFGGEVQRWLEKAEGGRQPHLGEVRSARAMSPEFRSGVAGPEEAVSVASDERLSQGMPPAENGEANSG